MKKLKGYIILFCDGKNIQLSNDNSFTEFHKDLECAIERANFLDEEMDIQGKEKFYVQPVILTY